MSVALITGAAGLVGSESCEFFHKRGFNIIGIDNDLRAYFFGKDGSTTNNLRYLEKKLKHFINYKIDIKDTISVEKIFKRYKKNISIVIHTAAQPSHEWANKKPLEDFNINTQATIYLLEMVRKYSPDACFIFMSSNKVYGDTVNKLPLIELEKRWELVSNHKYYKNGVDESMSIDQSTHSIYGANKLSADIFVQEYGLNFGIKTVSFRCGCITGSRHAGVKEHGFLAYLVKCVMTNRHYSIYGYKGKQVRDNIHPVDLNNAFWEFFSRPKIGSVYNIGGSRLTSCSILEAIELISLFTGKDINPTYVNRPRRGDHIWWISDMGRFKKDYPKWHLKYNLQDIIREILENY